jgi:hypothetical protein
VKLRHTLPLLAVGWYLMLPPRPLDPSSALSSIPPLNQWQTVRSFDTATACENALTITVQRLKKEMDADPTNAAAAGKYGIAADARCIASDDPRLK